MNRHLEDFIIKQAASIIKKRKAMKVKKSKGSCKKAEDEKNPFSAWNRAREAVNIRPSAVAGEEQMKREEAESKPPAKQPPRMKVPINRLAGETYRATGIQGREGYEGAKSQLEMNTKTVQPSLTNIIKERGTTGTYTPFWSRVNILRRLGL